MKILAINGSPRKEWNTATLINKALEGAASNGAETSLVHLYELDYKGCISCFACKKINGKSYGKCAVQDDLTPVYAQINDADSLILGSPVYFGNVTGEMRSFMERLLFQYFVYENPPKSLFPRKIRTAWIYTMNAPKHVARQFGYDILFSNNENIMKMIFGHSESVMSYDTYQFDDYSKVVAERFDTAEKEKRRKEVFPIDCQNAFNLGVELTAKKVR